jgi:hypothetical protein
MMKKKGELFAGAIGMQLWETAGLVSICSLMLSFFIGVSVKMHCPTVQPQFWAFGYETFYGRSSGCKFWGIKLIAYENCDHTCLALN